MAIMPKKKKKRAQYAPTQWKLDSGKLDDWDMDKVFGESVDKKGHSDNLRVRFPQGTMAAMAEIVDLCPQYTSHAALIRSGLMNQITYLKQKLADEGVFTESTVNLALARAEDQRRDYQDDLEEAVIGELKERLEQAKRRQKTERVVECRDRAQEMIDMGPSSPFFAHELEYVLTHATNWLKNSRET